MKNLTKEVLQTFKELALPTKNNQKQNAIIEIGKSLGLNVNTDDINNMGIYMTNKDESIDSVPEIIFVSHFDLVKPFEKGFKEEMTFKLFQDGEVSGGLDNTITNAALLTAVRNTTLPKGVALFFSNGEETGMWGMRQFFQYARDNGNLKSLKKKTFFINLDVTNDQYNNSISIEYDCKTVLPEEENYLKSLDFNLGIQYHRCPDDMSVILNAGMHGYSACIPTTGNCHTYLSTTHIEKIQEYTMFLIQRINAGNFI